MLFYIKSVLSHDVGILSHDDETSSCMTKTLIQLQLFYWLALIASTGLRRAAAHAGTKPAIMPIMPDVIMPSMMLPIPSLKCRSEMAETYLCAEKYN